MLILINSKKKNEATARNFHFGNQEHNHSLTIPNGERQNLELNSEDFLCAEAMQNYVSIFYVREHELTKELVRIPIKQLEELIGSESIVRCHRSFIVNKDKINCNL